MALPLLPLLAILLPTLLIAHIVNTRLARARKARSLACEPAPYLATPWYDPLGLSVTRAILAADARRDIPRFIQSLLVDLTRKLGRPVRTFTVSVFGETFISTSDAKNIQAVLATSFQDFEIGKERRDAFWPLLAVGIFTSDGDAWSHSRALLRPTFARDQVSDLKSMEEHTSNLLHAIAHHSSSPTSPIDLSPLFFRLTIDSATQFLFGQSCASQLAALSPGPSTSSGNDFAAAFDEAQETLSRRARLGAFYWTVNPPRFRAAVATCHAFIDGYVTAALQRQRDASKPPADADSKYLFLDHLAAATSDPAELRHQLLHVLLAGRDTTASSLGWTIRLLARHPSIYATLRAAVLAHFGPRRPAHLLSFESLKSCAYLQAVLSESLRLFPVVPLNERIAVRDTTLPRGGGPDGSARLFVPKGTHVGYSVYVMQRDAAVWGADAEAFRPERWEGRRAGWDFLPFNGGPRVCLGQQFALTSMGYTVVRLVQAFEAMEWAGEDGGEGEALGRNEKGESVGTPGLLAKLTMKCDEGCVVRLTPAAAA